MSHDLFTLSALYRINFVDLLLFTKRGRLQRLATFTHPQVLVIDEVGMKARYRIGSNVVMVLAVTRQLKWRESLCPFPISDSHAAG